MRITLLLTFFLLVISCGSGNETTSATTDEQNYFTLSEKTGYSLTELLDEGNKILQDVAQGLVLNAAAIADRGVIVQAVKDINKALVDISNNVNVENSVNIITASVKRYEASLILLRDKEILDSFFSKMMYLSAVYAERLNMEIPRYSGYDLLNLKMSNDVREDYFEVARTNSTPSWEAGNFRGTPFFKFTANQTKSESWLVSPKYDLKDKFPYSLTVNHTLNTLPYERIKLLISTNYNGNDLDSANWDEYSLDNGLPVPANTWFTTESSPINLEKYTGKKIVIAFVIETLPSDRFVWQINGFQIKGIGDTVPKYTYTNIFTPLLDFDMTEENHEKFKSIGLTLSTPEWQGGEFNGNSYIEYRSNFSNAESWLVSPKFNFESAVPETLTVSHTLRDVKYDNIKLLISTNYNGGSPRTAKWDEYSLSHGGDAPQGRWFNTQSLPIDIRKYKNKKIVIAFRIVHKDDVRLTWQVKNLKFTGSGDEVKVETYKNDFSLLNKVLDRSFENTSSLTPVLVSGDSTVEFRYDRREDANVLSGFRQKNSGIKRFYTDTIDLNGLKEPYIKIDNSYRFFRPQSDADKPEYLKIYVLEENNFGEQNKYYNVDFNGSEFIKLPTQFTGKKIKVAFQYKHEWLGDENYNAPKWVIKSLSVYDVE